MGGADVIPGVSGGTIAFITGIYEELLNSIKSVDGNAFKLLFSFQIKLFWQKINGSFLLAVFAGLATSLLSLAKLLTFLLQEYPIPVWSFFFGLILISSPLILREIRKWNTGIVISLLVGIISAFSITLLSPAQTTNNLLFIFICGSLAICAMILPGISGAFILLLLGKYEYIIESLVSVDVTVIAVFLIGCVVGILSFSRFLSWLLANYRLTALALLAGFMIGSLNKIWPWKEVLSYRLNENGHQIPAYERSIMPWNYLEKTGEDPQLFLAILFGALGILLIIGIEKIAERSKSKF